VALAAALPRLTRLKNVYCCGNFAGTRSWVALAAALPSLPALELFCATECTGLGSEGAAALVASVPQCPRLQRLSVEGCGLDAQAQAALHACSRNATQTQPELWISCSE